MAEIRTTQSPKEMTRLTLFPPSGKRIVLTLNEWRYDGGILKYTDKDGIKYETTLPFAIEHIAEGHRQSPFSERGGIG